MFTYVDQKNDLSLVNIRIKELTRSKDIIFSLNNEMFVNVSHANVDGVEFPHEANAPEIPINEIMD